MRAAICGILLLGSNCLLAEELRISDEKFVETVAWLGQLVAIPSVSNPNSPDYDYKNFENASTMIETKLKTLGFQVACPSIEGSPPYVLAERMADPKKPTILLYAHYDVQPVNREKWRTDPFVMQERGGRLYGRGASDDKAGIAAIITALDILLQEKGELPVNVKLLFEGEEEYGSSHMGALLEQNTQKLEADALVVLDGMNSDESTGTLLSSTRGLINLKLKVSALEKPVHSGIGCLAPDPAQALAGLIYQLREPRNIPGFMETIEPLSEEERQILAKSSQSAESYARETGVLQLSSLRGSPQLSIYERIVQEPSISVVNMNCGQPNGGNSIQESASCTIGIRVVPGQDPERVAELVIQYLQSQTVLYGLPIEVSRMEKSAWAWKADLSRPFSKMYFESLGKNFGASSALPMGGALPLLRELQDVFPKMEMIVPGVEDPHTSAHSHNESQDISVFRNSINTLIAFLEKAGS